MRYRFQYESDEQKRSIIESNTEKILVEEQNVFDGDFLIFEDSNSVSDEINTLKSQLQATQDALDFLILNGGM